MFRSRLLAAALAACAPPWPHRRRAAQEPFYKGKRLTVLINFDAGSATDIEARVFARHFAKHIEGAPQLIMQNMPAAAAPTAPCISARSRPRTAR